MMINGVLCELAGGASEAGSGEVRSPDDLVDRVGRDDCFEAEEDGRRCRG